MFKRIISTVATAVVALATVFSVPTFAADKPDVWLQISPVSNRVSLQPGQALEYSFTVENIGSKEFGYHVYAAPYSVDAETYDANFSRETNRTQISRWITFLDMDGNNLGARAGFQIQPGEKQTIRYLISVPEDIPEGGQYATIFAESDSDGNASGSGITTVSRVGLVIYGRTLGNTRETAEITDYNLTSFLTSGTVKGTALIKNTGNTDFETTQNLIVKTIFGKTLYEEKRTYDVLPDTERRLNMNWADTPMFGIFSVSSTVTALSETESESKIVLIIPLFVIIIVLILLTILIVWLIILIKKRKEQKSRLIV